MLPPFSLSVLIFSFIFLMARMIKITHWIVNYDVSIVSLMLMIFYSMPLFLIFVLPMSIMMSILLTFVRMSGDNEITALKTGGLSIYGLLPPVAIFCLLGFVTTLFMTLYGMPWASIAIKELTYSVAASNIDIGLKERTFNDSFKDVMLYVNRVDFRSKELIDVFIEDKRQPDMVNTVVAPRGKLYSEPEKFLFHIVLYNGKIHQSSLEDRMANSIGFDFYKISLDLKDAFETEKHKKKGRKEMTATELVEWIKSYKRRDKFYYKLLIELHQKFSLPFTCFALGVVALPLGLQSRSGGRSYGLILGLMFLMIYYFLLSAGSVLGKTGSVPPVIGMWVPNAVMSTIGIYLLLRAGKEHPIRLFNAVSIIQLKLMKLFRK
jgi:lipopolysaccharide export system permease protein